MHDYQQQFIEFCLDAEVLRFGEFTLKSGRISPYFFNAGLFNDGESLAILGGFYAHAIQQQSLDYDILFGPAYKGIALACTTAIALASAHDINKPFCYNRKEVKAHGEGGVMVGANIRGKNALLIDDVISAGTTINEAMQLFAAEQTTLAGVAIALDRQERGSGELSAVQEVEQRYQIPVISIISLQHIIDYMQADNQYQSILEKMLAYQQQYGLA